MPTSAALAWAEKSALLSRGPSWVFPRCCYSLVTKLCPNLCDPMIVARQAPLSLGFPRYEYWSGLHFLFQGIFPIQGLNPSLLHCRQILCPLSHQGSPPLVLILPNTLSLLFANHLHYWLALVSSPWFKKKTHLNLRWYILIEEIICDFYVWRKFSFLLLLLLLLLFRIGIWISQERADIVLVLFLIFDNRAIWPRTL